MHGALASTVGGTGIIAFYDFTTLTPGAVSLANKGLSWARTDAANNATVQTGAATLVKGIAADQPRAFGNGSYTGLLLEETRTNQVLNNRDMTQTGYTNGSLVTTVGPSGLGAVTSADGTTGSCSQATVTSGGFSKYRTFNNTTTTATVSVWLRNVTGTTTYQINFFSGADGPKTGAASTTWQRVSLTKPNTTNGFIPCDCRTLTGGDTARARDQYLDFLQNESGKWASSVILVSGTAVTRAGERFWRPTGADFINGGRITMSVAFRPLGASTEYTSDMQIWREGSTNHAEFDAATQTIKITINSTLYTTAGTVTWAAGDLVEFFLAAGGGSLATVVKYRVNGGSVVTLSTGSPPTQAAITVSSVIDLFCNGTSNQLSAVFLNMGFYRINGKPSWA